jgi:hypothetical protein
VNSGFVIETRMYTFADQITINAYVDEFQIAVGGDDLSSVMIHLPESVPAPGAVALLGIAVVAGLRSADEIAAIIFGGLLSPPIGGISCLRPLKG